MPNDSVTSPGPILVLASKLVSSIALRFVTLFNTRWSLSLLDLLQIHLQGSYFPMPLINIFYFSYEFFALEFLRLE